MELRYKMTEITQNKNDTIDIMIRNSQIFLNRSCSFSDPNFPDFPKYDINIEKSKAPNGKNKEYTRSPNGGIEKDFLL